MNTDASEMQIKNHQLSLILDEFEQWATIVPNLSLHQRQEISEHLQEQISQLATFNEPNGTRKQQFIDLERLSKLQQGPLGKLVDYGGFLVIMDDIIRKRLQALSSAAVEDGSEVSYLVIDNLPKQELTCRYVGPRLDGVFPDSYSNFKCWHRAWKSLRQPTFEQGFGYGRGVTNMPLSQTIILSTFMLQSTART